MAPSPSPSLKVSLITSYANSPGKHSGPPGPLTFPPTPHSQALALLRPETRKPTHPTPACTGISSPLHTTSSGKPRPGKSALPTPFFSICSTRAPPLPAASFRTELPTGTAAQTSGPSSLPGCHVREQQAGKRLYPCVPGDLSTGPTLSVARSPRCKRRLLIPAPHRIACAFRVLK